MPLFGQFFQITLTGSKVLSKSDKNWPSHKQITNYMPIFWHTPKKFKGLTQNSTPKMKVEIQFYVDSENFIKKY